MRLVKSVFAALLLLSSSLPAVAADFRPNGLIVLMTDFGSRDFYVGAMKGAILRTSPNVRIEDITHDVPKYDIAEGAYTLSKSAPEFPRGTVFLCVVDPGVGTSRKPLALLTVDGNVFIGPDNGLFTRVVDLAGLSAAYELTNSDLMGKDLISSTFHGRDVFGPVAAHLASGFPIERVGPRLETLVRLEARKPRVEGSSVFGEVTLVDEYGDILTNILRKDLELAGFRRGDILRIRIGDREVDAPFLKTYGDVPEGKPVCMISSGEVFETAINQGDLGRSLGAKRGDPVTVQKSK